MIYRDCRDCAKFSGDCGHHFVDMNKHIHYDICNETQADGAIGDYGACFVPSKEYTLTKKEERIKQLIESYSYDDIKDALESYHKDDSDDIKDALESYHKDDSDDTLKDKLEGVEFK